MLSYRNKNSAHRSRVLHRLSRPKRRRNLEERKLSKMAKSALILSTRATTRRQATKVKQLTSSRKKRSRHVARCLAATRKNSQRSLAPAGRLQQIVRRHRRYGFTWYSTVFKELAVISVQRGSPAGIMCWVCSRSRSQSRLRLWLRLRLRWRMRWSVALGLLWAQRWRWAAGSAAGQ